MYIFIRKLVSEVFSLIITGTPYQEAQAHLISALPAAQPCRRAYKRAPARLWYLPPRDVTREVVGHPVLQGLAYRPGDRAELPTYESAWLR